MDFNALKQKFGEFTKTATEKAKELGDKTLEFAGETLSKTPLFLHDNVEYKKILESKRAVILAFDEKNEIEKEVMKMLPIWQSQAFIDTTTFRYLNQEKSDILIKEENYVLPLEMRVFFEGNETHRFYDIEIIKQWWKDDSRDYKGEKTFSRDTEISEKASEETVSDPLSQK